MALTACTQGTLATEGAQACGNAQGDASLVVVKATAPNGIDESALGRPVGSDFREIPGDGGSLFPDAGPATEAHIVANRVQTRVISSAREAQANASAWLGMFSVGAGGGNASANRYATYRASYEAYAKVLDESGPMRCDAPVGAAFYVSRIFYGQLFEVVSDVSSSSSSFSSNAGFLSFGASVGSVREQGSARTEVNMRGCTPSDQVPMLYSDSDIRSHYQCGETVPIFVEYKQIPRHNLSDDDAIDWGVGTQLRIMLKSIDVIEDGHQGQAEWDARFTCRINGREVFIEDDAVLSDGGIDSGDTYALHHTLDMYGQAGDRILCGIEGQVVESNPDTIPFTGIEYRIGAPGTNESVDAKKGGDNRRVTYELDYEIQVLEDDVPMIDLLG